MEDSCRARYPTSPHAALRPRVRAGGGVGTEWSYTTQRKCQKKRDFNDDYRNAHDAESFYFVVELCACVCMCVRLPLLQTHPRLVLPVHSVVCLCAFSLALPLAISLFPQNSQVRTPNTLYRQSTLQSSTICTTQLHNTTNLNKTVPHYTLPLNATHKTKPQQLYRILHDTTQNSSSVLSLSLPVFVSCEEGYDLKWSVISCSSIWLLNCRHMCCQLLPFLSLFSPPPLLSLSRSLFTRFRGFQTSAFPKISHSCTPTFSHPMARLFQILPHKLAHSLPSVSEQNIARFSFALDVYQLISLFLLFFF